MFWNPAGLASIQGVETLGTYGSGGNFGPQRSALGIGFGIPGWGSFAVGATDGLFPGAVGLHENTYIVGAAVEVSRGLWLGTNQKFMTADPGGLRGWSMDAGLQAALGKSFRIGIGMLDSASALVWGNGLDEAQPATFQGGAAWSPYYGTWISGQIDWIDRNGSGLSQWRAGIETAWLGRGIILRGGATQGSGSPELFATAGLGSRIQVGATSYGLDYAFVASTASEPISGARHLASLSLSFGQKLKEEAKAAMSKVLKDPRTGKIHRAKINLVAEEDVKDWNLEITDKNGKVIRTFKGKGALPPSLSWDGKSDSGALMDGDGLSYNLRTVSHSGLEKKKKELLGLGGPAAASLGGLADDGIMADDFGLRKGPGGKSKRGSRVKPALKGATDFEVKGAEFDLSDVADAGVSSWELRIVDDEGKVVKKFSGKGRPPKNLKWEGSSDLGGTVDMGLGASYVLRTEDESGKETVRGDDLVSPDDFRRIAKSRPLPKKGAAAAAPTWCRKDGRGGWICDLPFAQGSSDLDASGWKAIEEAVRVLQRGTYASIEISGFSKRGEAADGIFLSQMRAETVLKAIIEGYELKPDAVFAKGLGEIENGRKAEVSIHNRGRTKE